MRLYLQLQPHYIYPQLLKEITIKLRIYEQQEKPNNYFNLYPQNHTSKIRVLTRHEHNIEIYTKMRLHSNGYEYLSLVIGKELRIQETQVQILRDATLLVFKFFSNNTLKLRSRKADKNMIKFYTSLIIHDNSLMIIDY